MKKKLVLAVVMTTILGAVSGCGAANQISDAVKEELDQTEEATEHSAWSTLDGGVPEEATEEETTVEIAEEDKLKNLDMTEYITLPEYDGLEVSVAEIPVTEDDIKGYINSSILTSYPVKDRAIKSGDVARIDYVGKKDGEAFNGGSANGYDLSIGSGTFIPGFEDGLIGVKPGETVDLDITFPEEYQSADLAGQAVVFTVTVQAIMETAEYDTVTEDQMKAMELTYASREEMWDAAKKECEKQAAEAFENNVSGAIYEKMLEGAEFKSIPDYLIADFNNYYKKYMSSMIQAQLGTDIATYLSYTGMTQEQYDEQIADMSEQAVKQDMIFEAIADAEGVEITEEELQKLAEEDAAEYQYQSVDAFLSSVGADRYRQNILQEKVLDKIKGKITVVKTAPQDKTEEAAETETETQTAAE